MFSEKNMNQDNTKNQIVDNAEIEALGASLSKTFDVSKDEIMPLVRKTKGRTIKEATAIMLKELQEVISKKTAETAQTQDMIEVEDIGVTINDAFSQYYATR